jgi:hypothetical protein
MVKQSNAMQWKGQESKGEKGWLFVVFGDANLVTVHRVNHTKQASQQAKTPSF